MYGREAQYTIRIVFNTPGLVLACGRQGPSEDLGTCANRAAGSWGSCEKDGGSCWHRQGFATCYREGLGNEARVTGSEVRGSCRVDLRGSSGAHPESQVRRKDPWGGEHREGRLEGSWASGKAGHLEEAWNADRDWGQVRAGGRR